MSQYHDLLKDAYSPEFAGWEKQALVPKDLMVRTPNELHDRQRIAHVIRCLRLEREPEYDPAAVFNELRKLVLDQTKALNCVLVYEAQEVDAIEDLILEIGSGPQAWSKLVRLLGKVRTRTMERYHALKQAA